MDYNKLRYTFKNPNLPKFLAYTHRNPFGIKMYFQHPETVPILFIAIVDMSWLVYSSVKGMLRCDISYSRDTWTPHHKMFDLLIHPRCRKFYCEDESWQPNQALYNAYMEVVGAENEYYRKLKECEKTCNVLNDLTKKDDKDKEKSKGK